LPDFLWREIHFVKLCVFAHLVETLNRWVFIDYRRADSIRIDPDPFAWDDRGVSGLVVQLLIASPASGNDGRTAEKTAASRGPVTRAS
jgi:hypothetical protein